MYKILSYTEIFQPKKTAVREGGYYFPFYLEEKLKPGSAPRLVQRCHQLVAPRLEPHFFTAKALSVCDSDSLVLEVRYTEN